MAFIPFELATSLQGHSSDVRNIVAPSPGVPLLLSGSRDGSAILWGPSQNGEWDMKLQVQGPEGRYISCVGMVRAKGEAYLLLGSSNGVLSSFMLPSATSPPPTSGSPEPHHTLIEHKQNLCCLDTSKNGLIVTGSWDKSVIIWKDFKSAVKIEAHEQAVWAVKFVGEDRILTASADAKIKLHQFDLASGKSSVLQEYEGHSQPVRGLSLRTDGKGFWSCANDSLVNLYTFDKPSPIQSLSGHTSFVYSVTALPDGSGAISSGEDGTLRVWSDKELLQTIAHPSTSLWSSCAVPTVSGAGIYVASAANDGIIRFFTREKELMAPETVKERWNQEISQRQLDKSQVGDVKHSDLPGMEALGREGKKDGQVIMIKNNDKVEAYQWSQPTTTWQQIGQVVDAVGSGRRQLHEGQKYDFVFDVDVSEGMPPLKLPYNASENPWVAAQKFLEKHDLPSSYTEQVVDFIHKSSGGIELGTGDQTAYQDPFTGGSRYTGASSNGAAAGGSRGGSRPTGDIGGGGHDPYTGGSSYSSKPTVAAKSKGVLPVTTFMTTRQMNIPAAKSKIASINAEVKLLTAEDEENLNKIYTFLTLPTDKLPSVDSQTSSNAEDFDVPALISLIDKWPRAQAFPLIDIARCLALFSPNFCSTPNVVYSFLSAADWGVTSESGPDTTSTKAKETNATLAMRGVANMFATKLGRDALNGIAEMLLVDLKNGPWDRPELMGAKWKMPAATVALNFSIMGVNGDLPYSSGPALLDCITLILQNEQGDNETIYRAGIALGNLLVSASLSGGLQLGKVQQGKDVFREGAKKLGEKRLTDLAAELDGLSA